MNTVMTLLAVVAFATGGNSDRPGAILIQAEFPAALKTWTVKNYLDRLKLDDTVVDGERAIVITRAVPKGDTACSLRSPRVPVTAGADAYLGLRLHTSHPLREMKGGRDGSCRIEWFDGQGKLLPDSVQLVFYVQTNRWVEPHVNVKAPAKAAFAEVALGMDAPDLKSGCHLAFSRVEFVENARWIDGDAEGPRVKLVTPTPNADLNSDIVFRLEDQSGVDWKSVKILFDGQPGNDRFTRQGDTYTLRCATPWAKDSLHRIKVTSFDCRGNELTEERLVLFSPPYADGIISLRDDGMFLIDGKPFFPIAVSRMQKAPVNGFSFETAARQVASAGFNTTHAFDTWRTQELADEFFDAAEKYGLMVKIDGECTRARDDDESRIRNTIHARHRKCILSWDVADDVSNLRDALPVRQSSIYVHDLDNRRLTAQADLMGDMYAETQLAYVNSADILLHEIYPFFAATPKEDEVPHVIEWMEAARHCWRKAKVGPRGSFPTIQAFSGWSAWKRVPGYDEIRASTWLAIIYGARGISWYCYTGYRYKLSECHTMTDNPEDWAKICRIVGEMRAFVDRDLISRDARVQPKVEILEGPRLDPFGRLTVSCLLKETGFLVAANSMRETVKARITVPGAGFDETVTFEPLAVRFFKVSNKP